MRTRRVAVLAVLLWVVTASPADAHTVTGVSPSNYSSEVLAVRPPIAGVAVRVLELGRRVELRNEGRVEVVVLGYSGEPYLRVGRHGVFENRRAPTTYLNKPPTVSGAPVTVPRSASADATPSWRRVSDGSRARWRDRRTRVEGSRPAAASTWTLELRAGARASTVVGRIVYAPPPSAWLWALVTLALLGATVAAAWARQWGRWLSVALAVLLASDIIHSFGTAAATHDSVPAQVARVLLAGLVTTVAWIAGIVALPWLQRNHEGGLVSAGAVGLVIAGFGGVTDIGVLTHSQVASVFPAVTARVAVAIAVGVGLGMVAAAALIIGRDPNLRPTVAAHTPGTDR
jgi:hypothetical protein